MQGPERRARARSTRRGAVLLALTALVLGASACGDDDAEGGPAPAPDGGGDAGDGGGTAGGGAGGGAGTGGSGEPLDAGGDSGMSAPDAGPGVEDAGSDAGETEVDAGDDAGAPIETRPAAGSAWGTTAGGGVGTSASYRIHVTIGGGTAPGVGESERYRVSLVH